MRHNEKGCRDTGAAGAGAGALASGVRACLWRSCSTGTHTTLSLILAVQVRDLMVFLEARQIIDANGGSSELAGGTVLPVPEVQPAAHRHARRASKKR